MSKERSEMAQDIYVITGNPGVGKHTVAAAVARDINYNIVDINREVLKMKQYRKGQDVDVDELKRSIHISKRSLVVGHLAPYVLSGEQITKAVVLRRSPYELEEVYRKRGYSPSKSRENLESEILGIIVYDSMKSFGSKVVQIDTTSTSPQEVAERAREAFVNPVKGDMVDWLGMIYKRGDMKKFFLE